MIEIIIPIEGRMLRVSVLLIEMVVDDKYDTISISVLFLMIRDSMVTNVWRDVKIFFDSATVHQLHVVSTGKDFCCRKIVINV